MLVDALLPLFLWSFRWEPLLLLRVVLPSPRPLLLFLLFPSASALDDPHGRRQVLPLFPQFPDLCGLVPQELREAIGLSLVGRDDGVGLGELVAQEGRGGRESRVLALRRSRTWRVKEIFYLRLMEIA